MFSLDPVGPSDKKIFRYWNFAFGIRLREVRGEHGLSLRALLLRPVLRLAARRRGPSEVESSYTRIQLRYVSALCVCRGHSLQYGGPIVANRIYRALFAPFSCLCTAARALLRRRPRYCCAFPTHILGRYRESDLLSNTYLREGIFRRFYADGGTS